MEGKLSHYGSIAGSVMAIFALVGFLGEPHLKDFIDTEIQEYDKLQQEKNSNKVKLRHLLGGKMGVADDEVHILLGKQYKNEQRLYSEVDSILDLLKHLEKEDKLLLKDINANYRDIINLEKSKKDK